MILSRRSTMPLALALLAAGCASSTTPIPRAWSTVPQAAAIGSLALDAAGKVNTNVARVPSPLSDGPVRVDGARLLIGDKVLAENLNIDSVSLSESRGEVAFSAEHDGNYDIALISTDGGAVHWMPNDPADEQSVQWAPRGNKISYVIRASGGDVVRTLHIPTAFQFVIPFDNAYIHALAWDPPAERIAVAYSTADASDRVEVVKYDGADRRMALKPAKELDVEVAPFAPGAIVLHPHDIRYNEKLPVVVWRAEHFGWSDARAALLTNARVAVIVTKKAPATELWSALDATAWLDPAQVFVVGSVVADRPTAITITGDDAVATGRYRRMGNAVTVPSAVVQSFAAGFIADHLERNPAPHGSSR